VVRRKRINKNKLVKINNMSIIGISGKINSGKDTCGKIIQYLTYNGYGSKPTAFDEKFNYNSNWEIKKFAAKLKQVCPLLTGIPVEDFEKQEVKDSLLGEEWDRYILYQDIKWSDKSFRIISTSPLDNYHKSQRMTVRTLLQEVGTEAMRDTIHTNVWVNALFADYKVVDSGLTNPYPKNKWPEHDEWNMWFSKQIPNWIITDLRFPNELKAIKDYKGITIRINRKKTFEMVMVDHKESTVEKIPEHPSETALDDAKFDYVTDNNGSLEELVEKVREILIKEKII
jgi:hypothetical protein